MIEIPEALTLARQVNQNLKGKRIANVIAAQSPHKFAWYHGDPQNYNSLLRGKCILGAEAHGGLVEIKADSALILIGDGVNLRYHRQNELRPKKHQLMIDFDDSASLSASVQMYGGMWCFNEGEHKNPYYLVAKEKVSPMTEAFDEEYFERLLSIPEVQKLSVKAFLATEQRIPGLGNGVLQDILWNAKLHPRYKVSNMHENEKNILYSSIKAVLDKMKELGGRDTEKDLFGNNGGYKTVMSKNNTELICPACGDSIIKENYLGGSIYYCQGCQKC